MKIKPILIVAGDIKSIFFEIFFKSLKKNKFKSPIILIGSVKTLKLFQKKIEFRKKVKLLDQRHIKEYKLDNSSINIINVKLTKDEKKYIKNCFDVAFNILNSGFTNKLINAPINKSKFLNKKFLWITEYISNKFKKKNIAMLIYNKDLSVCPLTTHLPLKLVNKGISKQLIIKKTLLIDDFYRKNIGYKPNIAVTGLNPHCESILKFNEDEKIIKPAIKLLNNKGLKIFGPFSADTIFLKQNRKKYDVIIGMYHDQVLAPFKSLYEYDAINLTLGLPFFRISPDHGPNKRMVGKNLSNPLSLTQSIKFLDKK